MTSGARSPRPIAQREREGGKGLEIYLRDLDVEYLLHRRAPTVEEITPAILHGWTSAMEEVFDIEITQVDLETLASLALPLRDADEVTGRRMSGGSLMRPSQ